MRGAILTVILLSAFGGGCRRAELPPARPKAQTSTRVALGPFLVSGAQLRETRTHRFDVPNPSRDDTLPLKIVNRSCNCLGAQLDRDQVRPGETAHLSVTFPCHARTATEPFSVVVRAGANPPRDLTYTVAVRTLAQIEVVPAEIRLRHNPGSGDCRAEFYVVTHRKAMLKATDELAVVPSDERIVVEVGAATQSPVENAESFICEVRDCLAIIPYTRDDEAIRDEDLRIRCSDARAQVALAIETLALVELSPASLYFQSAEPGVTRRAIVMRSDRPFRVLRLIDPPPWLTLANVRNDAAKRHVLHVDVDFAKIDNEPFISHRVKFACDHPEQEVVELRLFARVRKPDAGSL